MSKTSGKRMTKSHGRSDERGIVVILFALMATVVFGFIALALDVGHLQWIRVRAQTAADAAALAAVRQKQAGSGTNIVIDAARNDARLNGFAHGEDDTTVTLNNPPISGHLAGNTKAYEAVVRRNVPSFFLRFVGRESTSVAARAVARLGSGTGCIYALNKTAAASLDLGGSNSTYFSCDAVVESSNSGAFKMNGSGTLYMKNEANVGVVGGWNLTGQTRVADWPSGETKNPVRIDDPGDPFASRAEPSVSGLTVRSTRKQDGYFDMNRTPPGGTAIPSGIYCDGLSIGNTGSATFTMSGLYVLAGGGLKINSQAKVTGTNVTIYLTSGARSGVSGCNAAYDSFDISGQADVRLTAPTSGANEAMLIFQDRGITSWVENKINGGSTTIFNGAVYVKNSPLSFSGNNTSGGYLILVADTIKITGNSTVNADYSTLQSGSPVQTQPSLVE